MTVKIVFDDKSELLIDSAPDQNHDRQSDTTDHPIEDGADISDHIIDKADTFSLKGVLSSLPKKNSGIPYPHLQAFEKLDDTRRKGKLVTVVTSYSLYENMAITKISASLKTSSGESANISIDFKKFNFTKAKTSKVPKQNLGKTVGKSKEEIKAKIKETQNRHTTKKKKGLKQSKKSSGATLQKASNTTKASVKPSQAKPKTKSLAAQGVDGLRKAFGF